MSNMKAKPLLNERQVISETEFAELVIWKLPKPLPGSSHSFKYRLALIVNSVCVLRYDNETGKGDHRHIEEVEQSYRFESPKKLLSDFWADVDKWRLSK